GRAAAGVPFVFGWQFDLPGVGSLLQDHTRERRLAELDESVSIGSRGQQNLAGDSRSAASAAPNRLALPHLPARLAQVCRRKRWKSSTARYCHGQEEKH